MIFGDKLLTPRLRLRRVYEQDLPLLLEWSNSCTAHGDFLTPERLDHCSGLSQISTGMLWHDDNRVFLVELKDGSALGTLHYWLRSESKRCGVIALKISDPEKRNNGYGTEAQKYVIINLFERMKLESVEMYTDINNLAQQRCLKKLGFELVETLMYDDRQVRRLGHLFRLDATTYSKLLYYQYHYEE
ncbi:MAG: GNAT family N-acetyltransferase [Desulfotalea sp.]|nr:MAG: GNAT family N-acetyltransferase [Desulfotalea sp.]